MTESPVLDLQVLERLRDWGGRDLVPRMIDLFLADGQKRIDEIRAGLRDGDAPVVERGAHSLKSGAANLGASRLRFLAAELEEVAARGEPSRLAELVGRVEEAFEEAEQRLRAVREGGDRT
jgi:HPt (histidine-containing phosphotransfer) domain-containing protein